MPRSIRQRLESFFGDLLRAFGPRGWWPGDTPFEVAVGAILTQNTNWTNVEKAIANLKKRGVLDARRIAGMDRAELAELIRPAGYFNVKAARLQSFVRFLCTDYAGKIEKMASEPLDVARRKLLSVHGVGPETADSILLYALEFPTFVVDAYTRRIYSRHGFVSPDVGYDELKCLFEANLKR